MKESSCSPQHACDWLKLCREICQNYSHNQQKLGGPGKYVEKDESSISKRKYNRVRFRRGLTQWVFVGLERGEGGLAFSVRLDDRNKKTFLRLVRKRIRPGTTIISDEWPVYRKLGRKMGRSVGYKNFTVCQKDRFARVMTEEGLPVKIHTNKCEGQWTHLKHKV